MIEIEIAFIGKWMIIEAEMNEKIKSRLRKATFFVWEKQRFSAIASLALELMDELMDEWDAWMNDWNRRVY